ncbi:MAG: hypothetical protein HY852_04230 [Bradyrhizobium sp.]|uniref:hypothetical protein n=1 Tax=Bradyrhizobium sp. TaxID=376 RepID=UPI0025C445F9|nr:hypothetical protein [Bradyrhizobium sp.]MBI5261009.1 hypothetical protein [Bradyrhizobium sp.]
MRSATSSSRAFALSAGAAAALVVAFASAGTGTATAQSLPDSENGRYSIVPVPDGVLRLDTRRGTVSTCSNSRAGWACHAVPDERAALDAEIGRLQAQVENLKAQLAAREPSRSGKAEEAQPKSESPGTGEPKAADGGRRIEIPLPSDEDLDRVMSFLERAWRRLIDMAIRVQKDFAGKI